MDFRACQRDCVGYQRQLAGIQQTSFLAFDCTLLRSVLKYEQTDR